MRSLKTSSFLTPCATFVFIASFLGGSFAQKKGDQSQPNQPVPAAPTPFSDVHRDALLNGLQIITLERPAERIKCEIVVRSGAMYDLEGKAGLASLTQSTLLAVNPRLNDEIESLKGEITWGLDWDATWYRLEIPTASFETAVEILSRLLVVETIRPDAFKRAQADHDLRLAEAMRMTPAARADDAFFAALYRGHPYGHAVDGSRESASAILQGDVYDFERRFYLSNNAAAFISGPISHERVLRAFKILIGGWVKGALVPPTFRQPQRTTAMQVVKLDVPEAPKVELRGGVIGLRANDPDFVVAQVLVRILEKRLKSDASAQSSDRIETMAPQRLLPGPVYFSASIAPERAVAFSRAATDGFAALAVSAVSVDELATAKANLAGERAAMAILEQLREINLYALPRNYPINFAARLEAVTTADVHRIAQRLLAANALTLVVLGPVGENFKSRM